MSNENHETIADIVREMRDAETIWHRSEIAQLPTQYLKVWSDRIEAAHKRFYDKYKEHTNELNRQILVLTRERKEAARKESSQVGNAAKMREALEQAQRVLHCAIVAGILTGDDAHKALSAVTVALSDPPRNCDLLSDAQEALTAIHEDRCYVNNPIDERRLTVEWLFDEAKGCAK